MPLFIFTSHLRSDVSLLCRLRNRELVPLFFFFVLFFKVRLGSVCLKEDRCPRTLGAILSPGSRSGYPAFSINVSFSASFLTTAAVPPQLSDIFGLNQSLRLYYRVGGHNAIRTSCSGKLGASATAPSVSSTRRCIVCISWKKERKKERNGARGSVICPINLRRSVVYGR